MIINTAELRKDAQRKHEAEIGSSVNPDRIEIQVEIVYSDGSSRVIVDRK